MRDSDITKLRRKRARINAQLRKLEPLIAGYYEKLWQVEREIQALAPELELPPRRYEPNPHFARRELPRLILDIMREANGPMPVRAITVRALAMKGCTLPDPRTMKRTRTLVSQTMAKWGKERRYVFVVRLQPAGTVEFLVDKKSLLLIGEAAQAEAQGLFAPTPGTYLM